MGRRKIEIQPITVRVPRYGRPGYTSDAPACPRAAGENSPLTVCPCIARTKQVCDLFEGRSLFLHSWLGTLGVDQSRPSLPPNARPQRKNGLFKKAYELGVLCSVDVAVIIFEERPGHHVKLFQYCSTDVNSMVQRHLRVRVLAAILRLPRSHTSTTQFDGERDTRGPADFSGNAKNDNADDDDDEAEDDDGTRPSKTRHAPSKAAKVKTETTNGSLNANGAAPVRSVPQTNNDLSMIDVRIRFPEQYAKAMVVVRG